MAPGPASQAFCASAGGVRNVSGCSHCQIPEVPRCVFDEHALSLHLYCLPPGPSGERETGFDLSTTYGDDPG